MPAIRRNMFCPSSSMKSCVDTVPKSSRTTSSCRQFLSDQLTGETVLVQSPSSSNMNVLFLWWMSHWRSRTRFWALFASREQKGFAAQRERIKFWRGIILVFLQFVSILFRYLVHLVEPKLKKRDINYGTRKASYCTRHFLCTLFFRKIGMSQCSTYFMAAFPTKLKL